MNNPETVEAVAQMIERPNYLNQLGGSGYTGRAKFVKLAETLKIMDSTRCLVYGAEEFEKEFGKHGVAVLRIKLRKLGIRVPRVVKDNNKVYVWSTK
jgi:hypothetical protein